MRVLTNFIQFNLKLYRALSKKYPDFFLGKRCYQKELIKRINSSLNNFINCSVLELGGIDRPPLEKSNNYYYCGWDIEYKDKCNDLYDDFYVQSAEDKFDKKFDIIFSTTLIEHLKNTKITFKNIYCALNDGGITYHYLPSKNHLYALI